MLRMMETRARCVRLLCAAGLGLAASHAAVAMPQDDPAAYDAQDARLNAAYQKLSRSLDDAGRKALRDEERQWIAGRDTACKVPKGTVAKNACTTTQTSFRADELEKRAARASTASTGSASQGAALKGAWAYRSDCNLGHSAEFTVERTSPAVEGTWSDGTRNGGSQGRFKGEWRDGKLFVRFCSDDDERGGYPACPAYGDADAYVTPEGSKLAWYRASGTPAEGHFERYVVLSRKPGSGDVPKDPQCKDSH
jgi:hypothetical protein